MQYIELDQFKAHCRIDDDIEDSIIEKYIGAAEKAALDYIECSLEDIYEEYGEVPDNLTTATLMIAADLYRNREATTTYEPKMNGVIAMLLKPLSKLA